MAEYAYIDVGCKVSPGSLDSLYRSLSSKNALCSYFKGYSGNLRCKGPQLRDHGVDSVLGSVALGARSF